MLTMEQSKLTFRLASSIDAGKICLLFKKVIPEYEREINFWIWINRMLSDSNSIIAIAEYNGDIVGHYAIILQKITISDKTYSIGLGVHALIQSDKNDLVSIYEISNFAYKEAKRLGLQFIYGFPNKNYRLIQEKIERWKRVDLFNSYETDINNYTFDHKSDTIKIKRLDATFESFHEVSKVMEKSHQDSMFSFKKSLNYYCNRYLNHPHNLYEVFVVSDNYGNKACLVLKIYNDITTGLIKGHLIDFIKPKEFNTKTLLDTSVLLMKNRNVNILSFWPINKEIKNAFNTMKIEACGFDTFFGIKFLNKTFEREYKEELLNFENWTLHMGDSDAF